LLAALTSRLAAAPAVDMAICDSRSIDAEGAPMWPSYQGYYAEAGALGLTRDAIIPARDFARTYLGERNLILNASAVLWRRTALLAALDRCRTDLNDLRMAGDWRLYVDLLAHSDGYVAWIAAPLNVHRRHAASVTGRLARDRQALEIARVQAVARSSLDLDVATVARQEAYVKEMLTE
jgi:hypothetical protein